MLGNSWHKKEKPLLGLTGAGGGVGSNLVAGVTTPVEATGGLVGEYETGGKKYKSHTFMESGTFVVSTGGDVEYLVVAGGGGGGQQHGGGDVVDQEPEQVPREGRLPRLLQDS